MSAAPHYTLADLRSMMTIGQLQMADHWVSRLPPDRPSNYVITRPDFISATGLSPATVQDMIDNREMDVADWGCGKKSRWFILRTSAVLQIHKRILGIREPIPTVGRALTSQLDLDMQVVHAPKHER
ncbi:MAG: hypothetical protein M5U15_13600 [Kiritimatiellae bacterium]|nr:hypothetical protein [Kiritimatiellia bacterium]